MLVKVVRAHIGACLVRIFGRFGITGVDTGAVLGQVEVSLIRIGKQRIFVDVALTPIKINMAADFNIILTSLYVGIGYLNCDCLIAAIAAVCVYSIRFVVITVIPHNRVVNPECVSTAHKVNRASSFFS